MQDEKRFARRDPVAQVRFQGQPGQRRRRCAGEFGRARKLAVVDACDDAQPRRRYRLPLGRHAGAAKAALGIADRLELRPGAAGGEGRLSEAGALPRLDHAGELEPRTGQEAGSQPQVLGRLVGVLQHGLDVSTAAQYYTKLTIGDGLVSQIPALIISTAAGTIVTRSSSGKDMGTEVVSQLVMNPRALYIVSAIMAAQRAMNSARGIARAPSI